MRLADAVDELAGDLEALGALGDEAMADAARRLARAMAAPLSARLLEILGQLAGELDATLPVGRVEVRLVGADVVLAVVDADPPTASVDDVAEAESDADARITLRLPARLKASIETASSGEGTSVNTWIVRTLGSAVRSRRTPGVNRRLTGYGRS